jgi:predicted nucleotidyltransferase
LSSAGITWVDRGAVIEEARELCLLIRQHHPEVRRAILFGSFASGGGGPRSDLDIVLVVERCDLDPRDRAARYAPASARPVDLHVYTIEEASRLGRTPLLRTALERGIDLLP